MWIQTQKQLVVSELMMITRIFGPTKIIGRDVRLIARHRKTNMVNLRRLWLFVVLDHLVYVDIQNEKLARGALRLRCEEGLTPLKCHKKS